MRSQFNKYLRLGLDFAFTVMLVGAAILRWNAYGDPRLSIGALDTGVYIRGSGAPVGVELFTQGRPASSLILYKIFRPAGGYGDYVVSEPAIEGAPTERDIRPGFASIAAAQTALSIVSWSLLAFVLFRRIRHWLLRLALPALVLLFAYLPPISQWDHVLLSESVSFSAFAFVLAASIELAFVTSTPTSYNRFAVIGFVTGWVVSLFIYAFTRDTNAYILPTAAVAALAMVFVRELRQQRLVPVFVSAAILLLTVFIFHNTTREISQRGKLPLQSAMIANVFPYPDRVDFFIKMGMPYNEEMSKFHDFFRGPDYLNAHQEFNTWFEANGTRAYQRFLLSYPLWASYAVFEDLDALTKETIQPFFSIPDWSMPPWLMMLMEFLHPRASAFFLLDLLLILTIITAAFTRRDRQLTAWAGMFAWLFLVLVALLFISYHGDPRSTFRHVLVAVVPARLSLWILLFVVWDFLLDQPPPGSRISSPINSQSNGTPT